MNSVKTARTYTVEELGEKADLALNVPSLVEIVKNAPVAENGKINLTQVRDRAYQHAVEETHDLKDAKKLADSTRALAMLRRNFTEEFEKLISTEKLEKVKTRNIFTEEYGLPPYTEVHMIETRWVSGSYIRFTPLNRDDNHTGVSNIVDFCFKILSAIPEDPHLTKEKDYLRDNLIHLLEEKFGLKIKICGNCKHYVQRIISEHGRCFYHVPDGYDGELRYFSSTCSDWTPKKNEEKLSSA